MRVELLHLDQRLSLTSEGASTYVYFRLPDGNEVRAEVDPDTAQSIINAQVGGAQAEPAPAPPIYPPPEAPAAPVIPASIPAPAPAGPVPQDAVDELFMAGQGDNGVSMTPAVSEPSNARQTVEWRTLPDNVLNPRVKRVLETFNLPDVVPVDHLRRTVESIVERLMAKPPANPPRQQNGQQPKVGHVQMFSGPMMVNRPPQRKIQADAMGNPIAPAASGQIDMSQVTSGPVDEDGVGMV